MMSPISVVIPGFLPWRAGAPLSLFHGGGGGLNAGYGLSFLWFWHIKPNIIDVNGFTMVVIKECYAPEKE